MKPFPKDYKPPTGRIPEIPTRKSFNAKMIFVVLGGVFILFVISFYLNRSKQFLFEGQKSAVSPPQKIVLYQDSKNLSTQNISPQIYPIEWAEDSSEYWMHCDIDVISKCLTGLNQVHPSMGRNILSLVNSWVLSFDEDVSSIKLLFQKGSLNKVPTLSEVSLINNRNIIKFPLVGNLLPWLETEKNDTLYFVGSYCHSEKKCLNDFYAFYFLRINEYIFRLYAENNEELKIEPHSVNIITSSLVSVKPIFPGRVMSLHSNYQGTYNLELYHGRGVSIKYFNLSELKKDLLVGDFIDTTSQIGLSVYIPDSLGQFGISIQFEGRTLNTNDYLQGEELEGGLSS